MEKTCRPLQEADLPYLYDKYNVPEERKFVETAWPLYVENPAVVWCFAGVPVAAWGIVPIWPGLGYIWSIITPLAARYPLWLTKSAQKFLVEASARGDLRRVECTAYRHDPSAHRWLYLLGFTHDGLALQYGPNGEDHVRFVYFPKGYLWRPA